MLELREIDASELEQQVEAAGLELPIEQTAAWMEYQETIPGRKFWGSFEIVERGEVVGYASFVDYETHGYHYLRTRHAPLWIEHPDATREKELIEGLAAAIRERDRKIVFVRCSVEYESDGVFPTLSTVPYNQTVVIDLHGGEEEILSRMKARGRRDTRKSLRETPATYADETDAAVDDFSPYYEVMLETCERDGFAAAPMSDYQDMLRILGSDHARLFVARVDGRVVAWYLCTIAGGTATLYYGASRDEIRRAYVIEGLLLFLCLELEKLGATELDMMGIGDPDFSPELMGLNTFKTKFSKEVAPVIPDRDVPVHTAIYSSLRIVRRVIGSVRG